jgi:hypothetical protein
VCAAHCGWQACTSVYSQGPLLIVCMRVRACAHVFCTRLAQVCACGRAVAQCAMAVVCTPDFFCVRDPVTRAPLPNRPAGAGPGGAEPRRRAGPAGRALGRPGTPGAADQFEAPPPPRLHVSCPPRRLRGLLRGPASPLAPHRGAAARGPAVLYGRGGAAPCAAAGLAAGPVPPPCAGGKGGCRRAGWWCRAGPGRGAAAAGGVQAQHTRCPRCRSGSVRGRPSPRPSAWRGSRPACGPASLTCPGARGSTGAAAPRALAPVTRAVARRMARSPLLRATWRGSRSRGHTWCCRGPDSIWADSVLRVVEGPGRGRPRGAAVSLLGRLP